jgi:hypothetical protein
MCGNILAKMNLQAAPKSSSFSALHAQRPTQGKLQQSCKLHLKLPTSALYNKSAMRTGCTLFPLLGQKLPSTLEPVFCQKTSLAL